MRHTRLVQTPSHDSQVTNPYTVRFTAVQPSSPQAALELFHSGTKAAHYLSYSLDLIKFRFELIDLVQNGMEARNLCIRHLYGVSRPVVLSLSGDLCCMIEL